MISSSCRRIIKDQFERIRDADRFWFENTENEIFSAEEIASIKDITLWDVIVNSTDITEDEIQPKVIIDLIFLPTCFTNYSRFSSGWSLTLASNQSSLATRI